MRCFVGDVSRAFQASSLRQAQATFSSICFFHKRVTGSSRQESASLQLLEAEKKEDAVVSKRHAAWKPGHMVEVYARQGPNSEIASFCNLFDS